ncbi:DUF983 domain-containing protein [Chelatococcus sambhunathii]|uniref:DUF983 domain-containing protein n=1 Tax=Chelatococcus sambhunathii TaxID=363953 RepID=A0ABU1DG34_9HYPH|nr:DUF983 domain-containing protein [Chelatococcus sambhunathii]MDR4307092.1 DUF983 domain-containing protein [Chelatococcus sambhunathii]
MADTTFPKLEPYRVGLRGRCPRCGEGHLFEGFLKLKPRCEVCGLDYSYADPADGPAFFAITFACLPSALFAVWLELAYQAPYWVHAFTTLPIMLATLLPPLRPLKGWLVASQYHHKAAEARLVRLGEAEDANGW